MANSKKQRIELAALLEERLERAKANRLIARYNNFYEWQNKFCGATKTHFESCLCAANQIGKTRVGVSMDAFHLTGEYPASYPGHRFDHPPVCWCLGYSMEKTRDLIQKELFGAFTSKNGFEGGLIPKDRIVGYESAQGTVNAMRTVKVKHVSGIATVQFWSYTQGQHAIMGDVVDWVHVDEEPRDQTIRPQLLTRTINGDKQRGGRVIYTFTPENGRTDLVVNFMDTPTKDQYYMQAGWRDAPHMTEEKKERLLAQYPEHQRKMRSEGEPMLGHGRIYDIADEFVMCDPFEIPDFWDVIVGMDFGYDHPQAFVKLAINPDNDMIYVVNSWKAPLESAVEARNVTMPWIKNIPVAWPSDGLMHEKGVTVATQQKEHWENAGFNLLDEHATWDSGGVSVESGIYETIKRQRNGTYKIFKGQPEFMEEHRQYHRNEKGQIVKIKDDMLDAARYALMMRRCAIKAGDVGKKIEHTKLNFQSEW